MELDERSHILEHERAKVPFPQTNAPSPKPENGLNEMEMKHLPETPDSSKSDLHQLVSTEEEDNDKKKQYSSLPMASFNFINSIIGSGIIGTPYALKEAGFGLGLILILTVAAITDYSLVLLIHAGHLSNTNTYQDVMRAAFGRTGFIVLTMMQGLYPLIAMISYNVIIGDTITKIVIRVGGSHLSSTIIGRREFVIIATTLVVTLPLSLYRNVAKLSKSALLSICLVVILMIFVIIRTFTLNNTVPASDDAWQFANTGVTKAIGILAFAYMCHHNSFLIYESIYETNSSRWAIVTHTSIFFSMICTYILGISGYFTFTGYSQGDVLENYCHQDDLMNAARFFFAITIMLTFPIECFVLREVIENAVFAFQQPSPLWRHLFVTLAIVVTSVIVSMATDCLGIVLELNGVINASPLAFIFPALCVLKLQNEKILSVQNISKLLVVIFGVVVTITGFIMVVIEIVNGVTCSHGKEMDFCKSSNYINETNSNINLYSKSTITPLHR